MKSKDLIIVEEKMGQAAVVRLTGEVTMKARTSVELQRHFAGLVEKEPKWIIVDLQNVSFMDSSGIAALIHCLKKARAHSGRLSIAGMNDQIKGAFELLCVYSLFENFDTVEDALEAEGRNADSQQP